MYTVTLLLATKWQAYQISVYNLRDREYIYAHMVAAISGNNVTLALNVPHIFIHTYAADEEYSVVVHEFKVGEGTLDLAFQPLEESFEPLKGPSIELG